MKHCNKQSVLYTNSHIRLKEIDMKQISVALILSIFVVSFISCQPTKKDTTPDPLVAHIDTTVQPGNDFFQYANGNWFKANPIAASEQS